MLLHCPFFQPMAGIVKIRVVANLLIIIYSTGHIAINDKQNKLLYKIVYLYKSTLQKHGFVIRLLRPAMKNASLWIRLIHTRTRVK